MLTEPETRDLLAEARARRGPLAVRCPHCHAMPGDRCLTNSKRRLTPNGGTHTARINAAAHATAQDEQVAA